MTLQQLRYLVAVADHGTITAAAAALYVAQPALSRAVHALERELGVTLLTRTGRGTALTAEGRRVVRLARSALDVVDRIAGGAHGEREGKPATLRVVATPTLAAHLVGELVPAFTRRHPGTRVEVLGRDPRERVVGALRDGDAELGLVDLPVDGGVTTHHLGEHEVVLASPPGTDLPDPVPLDRLDGLPLVVPRRGSPRRGELEELFGMLGVRPASAVETDERAAWVTVVLAGGASLLWYRDIAARAFGPRAEIRSLRPRLTRAVGLVHPRRPLAPAARAFVALTETRWPAA
ncbi:DNA-binding transcriptional regulator, LysR family [Amycolatopsis arida]|uniref:DNA-binding transcriptional regulator, LysR family n=1 Tax=Amycolatopsis arida TaxID=587909 RepID=A0A1I6AJS0_9PSEU|nr:LysR family transcriptional regulator [Amycolatopsis arida]TDX87332.1 DNA-binding transcriptional LysR family regulator [Amycolatopsis arida]SFQ68971.1 DNA-binding transcriptional regulator, LysR family [Amycolatopsis arida]